MDYTGIKSFKLEHTLLGWEAEIQIDFNHPEAMGNIEEMVDYWTGGPKRLSQSHGDYVQAFLKQFAPVLFHMSEEISDIKDIINEFKDWNTEGFCDMDGSHGIKIISVDCWQADEDEFDISMKE
jgi:hypothetical protein